MTLAGGHSPPAKLVSLREAPERFASRRLLRELDEALARPPPRRTKINELEGTDGLRVAAKRMSRISEWLRMRAEPFVEMQKELLRKLHESKLEAWGVQSGPEQKRELERIPSHFFLDPQVKWSRNIVSNHGVTYYGVGVCRSRRAFKNADVARLTNPSRGRRSKATEIERATALLDSRGVQLATMQRSNAYEVIRKCAARDLKANVSIDFSDPVIQRALHGRFGPRR